MRKALLYLLVVFWTCAIVTSKTTYAQEIDKELEARGEEKAKLMVEMDKNKDGTVDKSEREAYRESLKAQYTAELDKDPEFKAMLEERAKLTEGFDKNKDGTLDKSEREAYRESLRAQYKTSDADKNTDFKTIRKERAKTTKKNLEKIEK